MGDTRREIPQITRADIGNKVPAVLIHRCNPCASKQHIGPFGLLMPVQLPHAAWSQAHINCRECGGNGQFSNRYLSGPAAVIELHMGVGEREFQIGNESIVRNRWNEHIRVLPVPHHIAGAKVYVACAVAADRLGNACFSG
ncbi:hypothetical protein D3C75_737710 [compost metagenome]